ncbi:MAG: LD-carboxypeptidase [Oscillospiraceae bacterium]|jgi:muramoyltetrapeptide carboxypeptidase LdcA involved in peptidoglycan recycling|nr:LD-carboxypeptidase [Oscillospiraceae bacterium]
MIKTVGIVSLSGGILGENLVRHELELGITRLESYGLNVRFLPHALRGIDYIKAHPEKRAQDLLQAFLDPSIDMILCAIGGDDTYRLLPYLFDHEDLKKAVSRSPKPFLGFSDTTINHLMLHKAGLPSFYGQAFLSDLCELDREMLPYTKKYFEELLTTGSIRQITPSGLWYESRSDYSPSQLGIPLPSHPDTGFRLLQGPSRFSGKILGGCIDSLFDLFDGERYPDMPVLAQKYELFPPLEDWRGKILLLESSEEKMPSEKFRRALSTLRATGIFSVISGILLGKPMDRAYEAEYEQLLTELVDDPHLPILTNLNVGHALPRCIVPLGVEAAVDTKEQIIRFEQGPTTL